jgi:hypothetical protein
MRATLISFEILFAQVGEAGVSMAHARGDHESARRLLDVMNVVREAVKEALVGKS